MQTPAHTTTATGRPGYLDSSQRRRALLGAVVFGGLTAGASLALGLTNFVPRNVAIVLVATGSVMTGVAGAISFFVSADEAETDSRAPRQVKPPVRRAKLPVARLHPLQALRSVRLPAACVLAAMPAWLLPDTAFAIPDTPVPLARIMVSFGLVAVASVTGWLAHKANTEPDPWGTRQTRGAGLDALATYTAAASIGTWLWLVTDPAWGLVGASAVAVAFTAFAGRLEQDLYGYGFGPVLLVTSAALAVGSVSMFAGAGEVTAVLVGTSAAVFVVLPARIREAHPLGPGMIEFASLAATVPLAIALNWWWLSCGVVVFLAAVVYSWRYHEVVTADSGDMFDWRKVRISEPTVATPLSGGQMAIGVGPLFGMFAFAGTVGCVLAGFIVLH